MFVRQGLPALAVIAILFLASTVLGQDAVRSPNTGVGTPDIAETKRVIVTGSNIPTAEEVGPNPVDTYRREDITRMGARSPSDLIQRIPAATGFGPNENNDTTSRIDL